MNTEIAVVGAGAAGLMASIFAARTGRRVTLFEKNQRPGLKILISGGGRCNLTTTRTGRDLEAEYGARRGRFLRASLRAFQPADLIQMITEAGVPLHEEDLEKIFPVSGRASDVLSALLRLADEAGVEVVYGAALQSIRTASAGLELDWDRRSEGAPGSVRCSRVILATGGLSYPGTGTTGDGYAVCQALGHGHVETVPALVPLAVADAWPKELAGLTIPVLPLALLDEAGRVLRERKRPVLFTHKGLSGPGAMDLGGDVAERRGPCKVRMDFAPELSVEAIDQQLLKARESGRKLVENCLPRHVPERVRRILVELAGAQGAIAELRKDARRRLSRMVKGVEVTVTGTLGFKHAEVTRGGVPLAEVDPRTMQSKIVPGLFLCGEILDQDGPIGGFNFQAAFATGRIAGIAAAETGWE